MSTSIIIRTLLVDFNRENNIAKEKNMELNCPVCNYKIDVNPLEKGKVITCPNCNSDIEIEEEKPQKEKYGILKTRYHYARLFCKLSQILAILLVVAGILVPVTMLIIKMTEIKKEQKYSTRR